MTGIFDPMLAVSVTLLSALATSGLIVVLRPLMVRYALARPNARSSHTLPTPQGGGLAIVAVVVSVMAFCLVQGLPALRAPLALVLLAVFTMATVGVLDDIWPMPVLPRLALQIGAAILLVLALPEGARALPWVPEAVERAVAVVGLVWFINLTNFMDGIDWMTVVEAAPVCVTLIVIGLSGLAPPVTAVLPVVLSLLGGILGFAPFNRHVARLFLGDVGSLPIGALLGWLLILLATGGHLVAALILPLYYVADATITLLRRLGRRERVWQAHRSHFYQIATTKGFTIPQVTARVFALNVLLGLLAVLSVIGRQNTIRLTALMLAMLATGALLREFSRGPAR